MTKITVREITHIAKLSGLNISLQEINKFQKQLSEIVNYISDLNNVDTSSIDPTSQTTGLVNVFRIDEVKEEDVLKVEDAISEGNKTLNNYFEVPAIFDQKDS